MWKIKRNTFLKIISLSQTYPWLFLQESWLIYYPPGKDMLMSVVEVLRSCIEWVLGQFSLWKDAGGFKLCIEAMGLLCPWPLQASFSAAEAGGGAAVIVKGVGADCCTFCFFGLSSGGLLGKKLPTIICDRKYKRMDPFYAFLPAVGCLLTIKAISR